MMKMAAVAFLFGSLALIYVFYQPDLSADVLQQRYTNEHSRFMQISGMRAHYRMEGQGPVVLLLHGTGASLHTWDGWVETLKQAFTVVRVDLPAFGLTGPHPEGRYDIESYVAFIKAFVDQLGVNQLHIAGNSLGGGIAWSFAASYPDDVSSVILIDSAGQPSTRRPAVFALAQHPLTSKLLVKTAPKAFMRKNLHEVYYDDRKVTDALIARYRDLSLFPGNRQAFVDRATTPMQYDLNALASLNMPVFILWGEGDTWIPVANARAFQRAVPESQLKIYPHLGHVPMEESPHETARDAMIFLSAVEDANRE